jgi:hypothetical protein
MKGAVRTLGIGSRKVEVTEIDGRIIWLGGGHNLTEPLPEEKIDLRVEASPQHNVGTCIGVYSEIIPGRAVPSFNQNEFGEALVKDHIYVVVGSLIIEYYDEWKMLDK